MLREEVLKQAKKCVCGERDIDYGNPENNFSRIARLWNAYFGFDNSFTAHDVAMMMALLKVARITGNKGYMDSYVDLAGYAACAAELGCVECQTDKKEED